MISLSPARQETSQLPPVASTCAEPACLASPPSLADSEGPTCTLHGFLMLVKPHHGLLPHLHPVKSSLSKAPSPGETHL
jgi:hypothetical protein